MKTNSTLYFILGHQKHNQIIKTQSEMFTISRYRSDPISKHDDFLSNQGESPLFQCVSETATRGVALGEVLETLRNGRCYESGNWGCYSPLLSVGIHSNVQIYHIPDGQCTMTAAFQRSVFADLETCCALRQTESAFFLELMESMCFIPNSTIYRKENELRLEGILKGIGNPI